MAFLPSPFCRSSGIMVIGIMLTMLSVSSAVPVRHNMISVSSDATFESDSTDESEVGKTDVASFFQSSHARSFQTGRRSDIARYERKWSEAPDQLRATHSTFSSLLSDFAGDGTGIKHRANLVSMLFAIAVAVALIAIVGMCVLFRLAPSRDVESLNTLLPDQLPSAPAKADENCQPLIKVPVGALEKTPGEAKQETNAEPMRIAQMPMGNCCCSAGFIALVHSSKADGKNAPMPLPEAVACDALAESANCSLPLVQSGTHPNFTGTFICVKADGDIDGYMKDIEIGWMVRSVAASFGYGAGRITRVYEHSGLDLKMSETGLGDSVHDYVIDGKERILGGDAPFLLRMWWDENEPQVLCFEGKDVEKKRPHLWTSSRAFFIDADNFVSESKSASGCVARWVYQRKL